MISNNSKHMIAYRTTLRSQQFVSLVELIDIVSDVSTVSYLLNHQ